MILEECISALNSVDSFGDNWLLAYDFTNEAAAQSSSIVIYSKANNVVQQFYEKLNLSILNGEYIDIETSVSYLDRITLLIDAIPQSIELPEGLQPIQNQLSSNLLFNFVNPIKNSIRDYKSFLHGLKRDLRYSENALLFEAVSINQAFSFAQPQFPFDSAKLNHLLNLNIKLAKADHSLSVKKDVLNDLIFIKNDLERNSSNVLKPIENILSDKCNFLLKKILYRFQEDSKNYLYAFDFEDKELQPEDLHIVCYTEFDKIMVAHYEKTTNHASQRKKWLEDVYEKMGDGGTLNFKDYHVAIKEYKDEIKNSAQVENLNEKFREHYSKQAANTLINPFDKRALHITANYMLNNEFSFILDQPDANFNTIETKYKEIKNLQAQTRIKNFFPYIKFAGYLDRKIELQFKLTDVDCDKVRPVIEKFENAVKDSYKAYEWCKEKNFIAFQPPTEECKVTYAHEGITYSLFIASSFVLPLNYEKILIELNEFTRKLEKFKTLLEVHENLKSEKAIIIELRENIEKNDRRSIEILGIFSAIVLFASSSVQIFSIKDIHFRDALKFMLCFSYSLTVFIFLVWLITRENIKGVTRVHWIFFIGLSIVAILSLLFTLNWWPFNHFDK
jgi:hypothetical protein